MTPRKVVLGLLPFVYSALFIVAPMVWPASNKHINYLQMDIILFWLPATLLFVILLKWWPLSSTSGNSVWTGYCIETSCPGAFPLRDS
jgi:hypothetical protein